MQGAIDAEVYRTPQELVRRESSPSRSSPRRVIIIGSCLAEAWSHLFRRLDEPCDSSVYAIGHPLPERPEEPVEAYDFQLVQLALRFVLPDGAFARLAQSDLHGHEALFERACARVRMDVEHAMRWNRDFGLLTFVMPFIVPQQNAVGRLLPRFDLRNPVYFVERLNEALEGEARRFANCFYFDFNEVLSSHGRRLVQEDQVMMFNHGSFIFDVDFAHDRDRIEPAGQATHLFCTDVDLVLRAAWRELVAMYRTHRQCDAVKLVVLDLDDTLWRGVAAEVEGGEHPTSEGWPKALWEACLFLKRRGTMLAILSKNDEARIRAIWPDILRGILALEDFAATRINWAPKAQNMAEILAAVNVLPGSVVYIDDNPVERAAVAEAFPEMRMLGGNPVAWRRVLLWSAETQVADVSAESAARTAMVRAQIRRDRDRREGDRSGGDHAAFLEQLDVVVQPIAIEDADHPRFARALELINKTNQFNTTGGRRTREGCAAGFEDGLRLLAFEVSDRYTAYGLVAVGVVAGDTIEQFVMSCRVMGIGVEAAAVAAIIERVGRDGHSTVRAIFVKTERNLPCQDIYARLGFGHDGDAWVRVVSGACDVPSHVTMREAKGSRAGLPSATAPRPAAPAGR